jgi:hypothetical protein
VPGNVAALAAPAQSANPNAAGQQVFLRKCPFLVFNSHSTGCQSNLDDSIITANHDQGNVVAPAMIAPILNCFLTGRYFLNSFGHRPMWRLFATA